MTRNWHLVLLAVAAGAILTACGGGSDSSSASSAPSPSNSQSSGNQPPATPQQANQVPTISGSPSGSVVAGTTYIFQPAASDADGETLSFSINGKPTWATFNVLTGALSGTPATGDVGSYANIVITVSDGALGRDLPAFAINVTPPPFSGTASLAWSAPTQNTDGSAATDLAGYRVYHGTDPSAMSEVIQVSGPSSTSYSFAGLAAGTHYFAVAAYSNSGVESALSSVGSKTIL